MAQRDINLGTPPAGTNGDTVRQAFEKVQANTTELYQTKQDGIEGLTSAGIAFLQAGDGAAQRDAIGLGNVDNTSDADKPVSTAQQAALTGKQDTLTAGDNITIVDNVISSTGGGSGSTQWGAIGGNLEDQIDLQNALNSKVDTVVGKGLSTNDFTDEDKARLDAGTDIAQGNRTGTEVVITSSTGAAATLSPATTTLAGVMSAADKSKIDGMDSALAGKQAVLVSAENIKTINGQSVLGSGDLAITATVSPWQAKPIGEPFPLFTHLTGVDTPPTNNPNYRYIKLTASDSYNNGVLTSESVSGSAPLVQATAVISDNASPMNGQPVRLINTERRFIRPGSSGVVEADAMQNITAGLGALASYAGTVYGAVATSGTNRTVVASGSAVGLQDATFDASRVARTANETRVKSIGADYYMRIR